MGRLEMEFRRGSGRSWWVQVRTPPYELIAPVVQEEVVSEIKLIIETWQIESVQSVFAIRSQCVLIAAGPGLVVTGKERWVRANPHNRLRPFGFVKPERFWNPDDEVLTTERIERITMP